jgi:hypothetical protein
MRQSFFEIFWRRRDLRKLLFLGFVLGFPGVLSAQLQDDLITR